MRCTLRLIGPDGENIGVSKLAFLVFFFAGNHIADDAVDLLHHLVEGFVGLAHLVEHFIFIDGVLHIAQFFARGSQRAVIHVGIGQQVFNRLALLGISGDEQRGLLILHGSLLGQAHGDILFAFQNGFRQQFSLIQYLFHQKLTFLFSRREAC